MSSFFAQWAPMLARYGWWIAAAVLMVAVAALWVMRPSTRRQRRVMNWTITSHPVFEPTVMVDRDEESTNPVPLAPQVLNPQPRGPVRIASGMKQMPKHSKK